nr:hypothetical protein [Tanacetum cinerariifolium]
MKENAINKTGIKRPKNYPTPTCLLLCAICALYRTRVPLLCWDEWGIMGKSGGLWWNGAGSGERGFVESGGKVGSVQCSDGASMVMDSGVAGKYGGRGRLLSEEDKKRSIRERKY